MPSPDPEIAGIGLVRTGTGSLSRGFPGMWVSHELGMPVLRPAALDRVEGLIDDETFLRRTRVRLGAGASQVDIATVHHLYMDVLAEMWPKTRFIVTMRDVRTWATSVLGMLQRKNAFLQRTGQNLREADARYQLHLTGSAGRPYDQPDHDLALPLMRYWADYHRRVRRLLDPTRVEYRHVIGSQGAHAHASPIRQSDRFMMGDRAAMRAAYESTCAELMSELFPAEHAQMSSDWDEKPEPEWTEHVRSVDAWLDPYVTSGELPPGASVHGWT